MAGPPPGQSPVAKVIDHPDYFPATYGSLITFSILAFVAVAIRIYTRIFIVRNLGPEDWMIGASMVCALACNVIFFELVGDVDPKIRSFPDLHRYIPLILKLFYAAIVTYTFSLFLTKVSIMLQYLRIFPIHKMRVWLWMSLGIVIAYGLITTFAAVFSCSPISDFWNLDPRFNRNRCPHQLTLWYVNGALNIATDLLIIILPMPMLKSLKLSRNQKLGLMIPFGLGGVVIVVSSLRLHALSEIFGPQGERTFTKPLIDIWSGVEICVGIICACAPVLKTFIVHYKPRFFGATSSRDDQSARQPATESRWSRWRVSWCPSWQRQGSNMSGSTRVEEDSHRAIGSVAHDSKSSMVTQTKAYSPPPPAAKPSVSEISTVSENVYPTRHQNGVSSSSTTSTTPGPGSNSIQPLSPSVMGRTNSPANSDVAQEISARVLRFSPRAPQTTPISWWSEASEAKSQGWG